jgi:hypothetical protein
VDLILLVQVLPLALGAAVSPTVLTVQIVLMADGSPGLARAWGLAIGRTTALAVLCVGGVGLLNLLPDVNTGGPSLAEGLISLGAGLALGVMALIQWRRPRAPDHHTKVAARLARIHPAVLVPVGFLWQFVSVSTLALFIPALHVVTSATAPDVVKLVALIELVAITSLMWLGPPLYVSVFGGKATVNLNRLHDWFVAHGHQIKLVVEVGFSVGLVALGTVITVTELGG